MPPFGCEVNEDNCIEGLADPLDPDSLSVDDALELCYAESRYTECPVETWAVLMVLLFLSGLCLGVPNANARAMLLNTNMPETRGTAVNILVILSNLGKGVGPLLASSMIVGLGRQMSFTVITIIFSFACLPYYITSCTYASDTELQVQEVQDNIDDDKQGALVAQVAGEEEAEGAPVPIVADSQGDESKHDPALDKTEDTASGTQASE